MQNRKLELPIIDYNDPEFSIHSFSALKKYGTFILSNVPNIADESFMLMKEFNDLSSQSENIYKPFLGGSDATELAGYHPLEQHWAGRRFSGCYAVVSDGEGKILQPFAGEDHKQKAVNFIGTVRGITDKVIDVIGTQLNVRSELLDYFDGYSILGLTDSYVPPTQEKIEALKACDNLITTEDGRLEAFDPHRDANPFTVIAYDNNDSTGLEMEFPDESGNLSYVPIKLPKVGPEQITPLVFIGEPLETLTAGQLKAPKHRVVLEPMKSGEKFHRGLTSGFTLFGPKSKEPRPLGSAVNLQESSEVNFDQTEYLKGKFKKYMVQERKENSPILTSGLFEQFPTEAEVEKVHTHSQGTFYIRR